MVPKSSELGTLLLTIPAPYPVRVPRSPLPAHPRTRVPSSELHRPAARQRTRWAIAFDQRPVVAMNFIRDRRGRSRDDAREPSLLAKAPRFQRSLLSPRQGRLTGWPRLGGRRRRTAGRARGPRPAARHDGDCWRHAAAGARHDTARRGGNPRLVGGRCRARRAPGVGGAARNRLHELLRPELRGASDRRPRPSERGVAGRAGRRRRAGAPRRPAGRGHAETAHQRQRPRRRAAVGRRRSVAGPRGAVGGPLRRIRATAVRLAPLRHALAHQASRRLADGRSSLMRCTSRSTAASAAVIDAAKRSSENSSYSIATVSLSCRPM